MKYRIFAILLIVGIIGVLSTCKFSNTREGSESSVEDNSLQELVDNEMEVLHDILYLYPSPGEIMEGFFNAEMEYKPGLTNSVENKDSYLGSRSQALNMGIYITDLAYSAKYSLAGESVDYLEAIQSLSVQVGVSTKIFGSLMEKVKENMNNPDSILQISNEAFYQLVTFMETSKKESTMAVISAGAFFESLYLVLESTEKYVEDDPVISQICETVYSFDNLLAYAKQYENEKNVAVIIKYLNSIDEVFEQFPVSLTETTVKKEEGKLFIGGGTTFKITEENFDEMKSMVRSIRTEITTI